jgi:hypothetical protein
MLVTICIFFISLTIDAYIFYYTTTLESFATSDMRAKLHVLLQGNRIHAQIYPPDHVQFKPLIEEGKVYNLSYFRVRASRQYRPVNNDHMINFTKWTSVEEVVEIPPAFPMYTYSLTPLDQLPPRADDTTFFTGISVYIQKVMVLVHRHNLITCRHLPMQMSLV